MATTPNTYGRFIGRVGALAVALGIGMAIANSPGMALAEDGSPGAAGASGSASNAGSSTSNTGDSSGTGSTEGAEDSDDDGAAADDSAGAETGEDTDDADADDEQGSTDDTAGEDPASTPDESSDSDETSDSANDGDDDASASGGSDNVDHELTGTSQIDAASSDDHDDQGTDIDQIADSPDPSADSARAAFAPQAAEASTFTTLASLSEPSIATPATTGIGGIVSTVLSAFGFGPHASSGPVAPPQPPLLWAMLGWVRREIGHVIAPFAGSTTPVAALVTEDASITADSPLGTPEQLAAEKIAAQTANTLPVALMKIVLRQQFLDAAKQQYPNGLDAGSLAALDKAVDEYAMGAAFQQQLLNSMTPTVVTQVAPPHIWFGQDVPGSRILYDNPDTIYRFMGVNGASEYEIRGQFLNYGDENARPADTTFSVLEGLAGTTSSILTADDLEVDEDGKFVITVSTEPADERPNHLQLTSGSTIIAARNTLGDWNAEDPMTLSIERVGGPPNSLFAQVGGFAFLGPQVASNPLLTTLVSLVPPLPYMPPVLRGAFAAVILVVRGASQESKYMALASTDPDTGEPRPANTVSQPASNAEFLANQLQSNGHYELQDGQALVLRIDPGRANYFVVPTYDVWTITDDYWNKQTSLNNEQAIANADGTYTVVISPTDPGVTNWIDTGGLHQGTISIRFQDLDPDPNNVNAPRIVDQQVIDADDAASYFAADPKYVVTDQQRADQLAERKDGFNKRWAPFPQP
ncbi:MAG: hypothetical protein QOD39_1206 [Mycobacterium sp.]|nr:hypothetical protein [Mycobacterium sp.]